MIRFSKYIWLYFAISALVLVPGIISLVLFGVRPSIDFTGGALMEVAQTPGVSPQNIAELATEREIEVVDIKEDQQGTIIVRMKPVSSEKLSLLETDVSVLASNSAAILRVETVGPLLGKELLVKAGVATVMASIGILLFVAYTFKNLMYGIAAVTALVHDVLVVFGLFSIFGYLFDVQVDTLFVTAFLTTMSFSVHDTIVVFDRIREYGRRGGRHTFEELCDIALTETIGRSITNSLTIIFMLLALVLLGGETIRWFAVALLIGTVAGTYSSPFIATPVLMLLHKKMTGGR